MLITSKEIFVIPGRLKLLLSSLLVILLTLSPIVKAQLSPQTSQSNQKQTALKRGGDEQPPTALSSEADDTQDAKLAVYQVHRLAEKILALRNVPAKAYRTRHEMLLFE